jgi:ABC-type uncharacterized transport system ATPase subunit
VGRNQVDLNHRLDSGRPRHPTTADRGQGRRLCQGARDHAARSFFGEQLGKIPAGRRRDGLPDHTFGMERSVLSVHEIEVIYDGSILAVSDISLNVGENEIVALLWANVIDNGTVALTGSASELLSRGNLHEIYLGNKKIYNQ